MTASAGSTRTASERHKVPYAEVGWESDRVALLQRIEQSDFFQKIRGDLVVSLYNQKELWPKFGYEGSSAEHGGYIKRGFADIDGSRRLDRQRQENNGKIRSERQRRGRHRRFGRRRRNARQ